VIKANDVAQTRAELRGLAVRKIIVTPTKGGWTFAGDGSLGGMTDALGVPSCSPRITPYRIPLSENGHADCAGKAGARTA
jgi:hypothetical protein